MTPKVNPAGEEPAAARAASGDVSAGWVPPSPPILSSAERGWTEGVEAMRFKAQHEEMAVPPLPSHVVVVHLGRQPVDLAERLDGRVYEGRSNRGQVAIVPAGLPSEWRIEGRLDTDILHVHLGAAFTRLVTESLEVEPNGLEIVNRLAVSDPQIERLGLLLDAELETGGGLLGGGLYADSLAHALAISVLRHHSSLGKSATKEITRVEEYVSGLSKRSLQEAIDYINDNLAKKLTLAEIAGAAHLSPYHFSHLFKRSTGLSPYQYVLGRRVQRAKELLASSTLPIADVALSSGFSSQSHLTRHFKRLVGTNPKVFR